ncbi:hypothetical protein [Bradyrhizobium jicamae]|uniref:hypothetical protein n=1 Tax=Bradyrhizobium jicamae TaxID=280332 RepID=UPI0012EEC02F|nr:hypothetical protein [Bradyrhizobium jicamae]
MARKAASGSKPSAGDDLKIDPSLLPTLLQHAADVVVEAGSHAAELADEADGRGKRCREYFRKLTELFDLYTSPTNLAGGNPKYPLPAIVAKQLGSFCSYLSAGIIPDPIKHCARRGRPLGPDEGRDVRYAVIYVLAAKRRLIRDRHPLETIVKEYGLSSRKTVQTWIVKHREAIAQKSFADPGLIMDRMHEAARRYRVSGHEGLRGDRVERHADRHSDTRPVAPSLDRDSGRADRRH